MASPGDKQWPLSYRCSVSHDDGGVYQYLHSGGDDSVNDHDGAGGDVDDDGSVDDDDFPGLVPRGCILWMSKDWSMMGQVLKVFCVS